MSRVVKIRHALGDVEIVPSGRVDSGVLKRALCSFLDSVLDEERISASLVHDRTELRHGAPYRTPGYFLRVYRLRADMTQRELARKAGMKQHHISEMEHGKRPIGKGSARKFARALGCDYQRLL